MDGNAGGNAGGNADGLGTMGRIGGATEDDGDTTRGCGAGWIVVRGGSQGGIGDEQATRPIDIATASASTGPLATTPRRPCPATPTKQTARLMHRLPKRSLRSEARNRRA
uniref:Uncharacterized protein n=1 Tax=Ralstonia solanacearum CFBP2957 TaxID=859656 RepID=D8P5B7_RALSL|nr:conserved protein of unknown function [Ralstonia solanacearum CFBP2957]